MAEKKYIELQKAIDVCEMHYEHCLQMHDWSGDATADNIKRDIETIPTADVVEVKHGKWLYWQPGGTNHLWKCSVCDGAIVTPMRFVAKHIAFCEHCGADMREEGADNDS